MQRYDYGRMSADDLRAVLGRGETSSAKALDIAAPIVRSVREEGDRALLRFARKLEGFRGRSLSVPRESLREASSRLPDDVTSALKLSARRISAYHKRQRLSGFEFKDSCGVYGQKVVPLERVGLYIPGGTAVYASSVLMTAIPANLAGVEEIVMCTPSKRGAVDDGVLAAADIAGVDEIYSVGGAQSISAMAYGTESIRRVQKIVGPGGSIVSAAKSLVRPDCEIDAIAGPSEVLIIADSSARPELLATEMAAQLEHDPSAVAVLVSPSDRVLNEVSSSLECLIETADRRSIMEKSSEQGAVFVRVANLSKAVQFSNDYAPEHLLIDTRDPESVFRAVRNAGSVFLGSMSSVAFGDYCSGPNHVLPTMGTARARSALSVYDFVKVIPYQQVSATGAASLARATACLAEAEGLPNHAIAARKRPGGVH